MLKSNNTTLLFVLDIKNNVIGCASFRQLPAFLDISATIMALHNEVKLYDSPLNVYM